MQIEHTTQSLCLCCEKYHKNDKNDKLFRIDHLEIN